MKRETALARYPEALRVVSLAVGETERTFLLDAAAWVITIDLPRTRVFAGRS